MNKHDEYVERLNRIENKLDIIIKYLLTEEQSKPVPDLWPKADSSVCSKCGMDFSGRSIGYVCYRNNCPMMVQVTSTTI